MGIRKLLFISTLLCLPHIISSQEYSTVYGSISDTTGYTVGFANITIPGTKYGATADRFGQFELKIPSGKNTLLITCVGYKTNTQQVNIEPGKKNKLDIVLEETLENVEEVKIVSRSEQSGTLQRIDAKTLGAMPNSTGNIENIVKQLPGVSSNNELSSQYSVRGGSFDENLVYVNDIEIYRPVLIRSGQQEGLSFVNPDMVGSLKFSAGGFDATYGDKMSSVLDITYKKPTENTGSFSASFLGGSLHYEGVSKNNKLRHLTGIRYKTTQYILSGMDTKGEYKPSFVDAQTNLTYDLTPKLEISFLGNFAQNQYDFIPDTREVEFGTFQTPLKAEIFYEGQEDDKYQTGMGAFTLNYHVGENFSLKFIGSAYSNHEAETFDLLGEYRINEVDKSSGKDSSKKIGVGGFLNHARNFLNINIFTYSHIGLYQTGNNKFKWGITFQNEKVEDRLNEWEMIDSAGYLWIPKSMQDTIKNGQIELLNTSKSNNNLNSSRIMSFLQYTLELSPGNEKIYINAGIRTHYWSLNKQNVINPRFSISYKPSWKPNLLLYFASGFYNQPAFYKELRNAKGVLNKNIKAQEATNFVVGGDYVFYSWSRPFKLTTELYYKNLHNLIPYRVDNVRSIYAGENLSNGYAKGIDIKLNGEFVKGTESWFSLSLLETREDIKGDSYIKVNSNESTGINDTTTVYPGYYSRPTDQLLNFSMYFQDYIPRFPSYKVHLSIHYGGMLPITMPLSNRWDNVHKLLPSYKRVDLGISKMLKGEETQTKYAWLNHFKEMWISAEVFNLIGISNTVSYMWIKTFAEEDGIPGYFAVPNYLTSRRLNIKLTATF
jgi:hypothetical protein